MYYFYRSVILRYISWDCGSIFVFEGIIMFEKGSQRFLTPGIKEGVPLEVQLLLWHLIDDSVWQMDYLQIFELYKENHPNKLIFIMISIGILNVLRYIDYLVISKKTRLPVGFWFFENFISK